MDLAAITWGTEYYRLAKGQAGPRGESGFEEDLFAGLA
jgi:N-acetyl-1-D-myo-inositol-2-amino-2-deoxy-alpha-D-glucopyranoside deacetylase